MLCRLCCYKDRASNLYTSCYQSVVITIDEVVTITTCIQCNSDDEVVVTIEYYIYHIKYNSNLGTTNTVTFTETSANNQTSCSSGCTKSKLSSLSKAETESTSPLLKLITSSSSSRSLVIRTQTIKETTTSTLPSDQLYTTKTTN